MILGPVQKFIFFIIVLLCLNYIAIVLTDKYANNILTSEGFTDKNNSESNTSLYTWVTDPYQIYDEFYSGVYDQLTHQAERTKAKVAILKNLWSKNGSVPSEWSVLDAGCGTGHGAIGFTKMDAGRVVGMDSSPQMLRYAEQSAQPKASLTAKQAAALRWRNDTLKNPSSCSAGEFSHIFMFYFTFYYIHDQEEFFRFTNLWLKPGGKLVIEVVNKHKFDPILESASPFIAFSLQKYSKDRLLKSKVTFDKFEYESEFQLTDPKAEFYETFRFKNNHVRRQKHIFNMPTIDAIVKMGKRAGLKYVGYQDLNAIGFEYGYLLQFER